MFRYFFLSLAYLFFLSTACLSSCWAIDDCNSNGVDDLQDIIASQIEVREASGLIGQFDFSYADMNRDGCVDLVSNNNTCGGGCSTPTSFSVFLNDCQGNFEKSFASNAFETFGLNSDFELVQANPFGFVDVLEIPNTSSFSSRDLFSNSGDGTSFAESRTDQDFLALPPEGQIDNNSADIDGDGIDEDISFNVEMGNPVIEIAFSACGSSRVYSLPEEFVFTAEEEVSGGSIGVIGYDINRDSQNDLIVFHRREESAGNSSLNAAFFINIDGEELTDATYLGSESGQATGVTIRDLNYDGYPEVFLSSLSFPQNARIAGGSVYSLFGNATSLDANSNSIPDECETEYTLWNSNLNMFNILEVINQSDEPQRVWIEVRDDSGERFFGRYVTLPARSQRDFILNDLNGFESDKFGVVAVRGEVTGRLQFYRPQNGSAFFSEFDYSFGTPLESASTGTGHVGFNTFEPSANPLDQANSVFNWLSLVNLSSTVQSFVVERFGFTGELIDIRPVSLASFERIDLAAGHDLEGRRVGLIRVNPRDSNEPYVSQIVRYGANPAGGFNFAFPLKVRPAPESTFYSFASTQNSSANWLELLNVKDESVDYTMNTYSFNGSLINSRTQALPANGQQHIFLNDILGENTYGYVEVIPAVSESIIAQSMFYARDVNGSILSMYGTQDVPASSMRLATSYNAFLGMNNTLKISNFGSKTENVTLSVDGSDIPGSSIQFTFAPFETKEFDLSDTLLFGTRENSYGALIFEGDRNASIGGYVVREHSSPTLAEVDFRSPSIAR